MDWTCKTTVSVATGSPRGCVPQHPAVAAAFPDGLRDPLVGGGFPRVHVKCSSSWILRAPRASGGEGWDLLGSLEGGPDAACLTPCLFWRVTAWDVAGGDGIEISAWVEVLGPTIVAARTVSSLSISWYPTPSLSCPPAPPKPPGSQQ